MSFHFATGHKNFLNDKCTGRRFYLVVNKNTPYVKGEFYSKTNDKLKFIPEIK